MTISLSKPKPWVCDQGTPEWHEARRGRPTASNFHLVFTEGGKPSKDKFNAWTKQAKEYAAKLVTERVLEEYIEDKVVNTYWVEWGKLQEPAAIKRFSKDKKLTLETVDFFTTSDDKIGCSPDCLVAGSTIPVEIKCPAPNTLMFFHLFGSGEKYYPQVQGQMLVMNAEEAHLFVHHPRMPAYYQHTPRDDRYIAKLYETLDEFCDLVDGMEEKARALKGGYMDKEEWMRQVNDGIVVFPGAFPWRERS